MFEKKSPFERLRALLEGIDPGADPVDLTVGSPRHAPPAFVADVLAEHAGDFMGYPTISGTAAFRNAVHKWIDQRFNLEGFLVEHGDILPVSGSREGLYFAAGLARDLKDKANPVILFANPAYQTYPAAAHAIRAEAIPMAASGNSVLPNFDAVAPEVLDRTVGYYFASPSNPQGASATMEEWHALFDVAERHDFFVFADECYSEIYRENVGPPVGALEAARTRPGALDRLIVFNSLSKRSNLAGLRVGFVAGSRDVIAAFKDYRNLVSPQVPAPLQAVAAATYADEAHVVENRRLYDEKYALVPETLGLPVPPGGFFLWVPVDGDDIDVTRALWRESGVRVVPGSYLALTPSGRKNPGRGFVRLALVADASVTREALSRIASARSLVPDEGRVPGVSEA
ncbi:aminotransferase class I/II-fold pyridoxal phosphate-dependent enzyme [Acuticoccus sp. MNP-M23]|uniref:aminotransferase class I/II-fold pyridoxal phosphate-dependent enzyme n=1 Tax=Acuticoccus sp. MNP-M23 TaxID=3072793 RepID=UPI002815298E|nr:aminotransferase class I/II-fold pyridoxal phosphate-dependent enzyme [Acuticoccus sp. MNP-M23]WMS43241.1 aminotransferase class I/II-fold pyridoxal phosphate-dependent enzyme [Acuticoccus sp. MNP-M23]